MPLSRTLADLDILTRARLPETAIAERLGVTRRSLEYLRRRHGMRVADVLRRMVAEQVTHAETAALGECAAVPVVNVVSQPLSSEIFHSIVRSVETEDDRGEFRGVGFPTHEENHVGC